MSKKTKEDDSESLVFKAMLENLEPKLRALKVLDGKKYKRFAKGVEAFLRGGVNNPGTILSLVAASVQMPDTESLYVAVDREKITFGDIRAELLAMWRSLGFVTQGEIEKREEGE